MFAHTYVYVHTHPLNIKIKKIFTAEEDKLQNWLILSYMTAGNLVKMRKEKI